MKTIKITVMDHRQEKEVRDWFTIRNRLVHEKDGSMFINTSRYELKQFVKWAVARHIGYAKEWVDLCPKHI